MHLSITLCEESSQYLEEDLEEEESASVVIVHKQRNRPNEVTL